jgi:hypothetical protein
MLCSYPKYDFCLYKGEDKELFFTFSYQSDDGSTVPMKLDGCTFEMSIALKASKQKIDKLTSDNGRLVIGVLDGGEFKPIDTNATALQATFPHVVTEKFPESKAEFDLLKTNSTGHREVLLTGNITIHSGVTYA